MTIFFWLPEKIATSYLISTAYQAGKKLRYLEWILFSTIKRSSIKLPIAPLLGIRLKLDSISDWNQKLDLLHNLHWKWYQSAALHPTPWPSLKMVLIGLPLTDLQHTFHWQWCYTLAVVLHPDWPTLYPLLPVGLPPGSPRGDLHTLYFLDLKWKQELYSLVHDILEAEQLKLETW